MYLPKFKNSFLRDKFAHNKITLILEIEYFATSDKSSILQLDLKGMKFHNPLNVCCRSLNRVIFCDPVPPH